MASKSVPKILAAKVDVTRTLVRNMPARPLGAVLRVTGAKASPATFKLTRGKCVIGSGAGCDVLIGEPTVSRQHVELELVPEGVKVEDLGSRNGTLYLGQRIEKVVLALGARIAVGAAQVAIDADAESLEKGAVYPEDAFRGMVGGSVAMRRLFATLARLEGSLVLVLVTGESGVGKELVASAIHEGSKASKGPLVVVNCGAIARDLVASELFGHKRGAFTGAVDNRKGAFEEADGGTLFLDELGELPLEVQPMLLRALETGIIRPVGGDQSRQVRVRVVAATNRDLAAEVRGGRFREDLYYRVAVVKIEVPPLRERPEDIEPLARAFATQAGIDDLPATALQQLRARSWPGNVRELRNAILAYAALGVFPDAVATAAGGLDTMLADLVDAKRAYAEQKEALSDRFTRVYLQALMAHTGGNQTAAARVAGLNRSYLGTLLVKHGLAKG
jgi:two-component system response regulator GlrR